MLSPVRDAGEQMFAGGADGRFLWVKVEATELGGGFIYASRGRSTLSMKEMRSGWVQQLIWKDEEEDRQPRVPGTVFEAYADNRTGILRHDVLQGNEQVYVKNRKESGYTMENVLYSAQYREMYKAIRDEIRGIGTKSGG